MTNDLEQPTIVVSLGTDHHKFDRLVDWIEEWLSLAEHPPACLIQHGASRQPVLAAARDRMPRPELLLLYENATVVVVQGGPGSILDARSVGHIPIAVPRRPELHEVVDGHQIAFTRTMAKAGEAIAAESPQELFRALDAALLHPESVRTPPRTSHPEIAGQKLQDELEHLAGSHTGPIALRRLRQVMTRH